MDRKVTPPIPEPIAQLQRQLEQFRSTQPPRTKLPDSLWQAAVDLARQHGVYRVAHPLKLDYMGLKKRLDGVRSPARKAASQAAAFVELVAPQPARLEEGSVAKRRRGHFGRLESRCRSRRAMPSRAVSTQEK